MFSKRSIFSTIGLIALVGVTNYISLKSLQHYRPETGVYVTGIAKGISVLQMDEQGLPDYQGHANKAVRYSDGRSRLYDLTSLDYQPDSPPWHLNAKNALVFSGSHQINLWDNVHIWRSKDAHNDPIDMKTSQVTYYPHRDLATTKEKVTISEPGTGNITSGVGMTAHPKGKTADLQSDVQSTFDSPNANNPNANDDQHPIHITSRTLDVDAIKGLGIYAGDVIAHQGTRHLSSETLTVHREDGKVNRLIAKGDPAHFKSLPAKDEDWVTGHADKITYAPQASLVTLTDKAYIKQSGNSFNGPKLMYNTATHVVTSPNSPKGRSEMILQPLNTKEKHHEQ